MIFGHRMGRQKSAFERIEKDRNKTKKPSKSMT